MASGYLLLAGSDTTSWPLHTHAQWDHGSQPLFAFLRDSMMPCHYHNIILTHNVSPDDNGLVAHAPISFQDAN